MKMSPMIESLVLHFGEMGSRWGFNRTVGQMLALIVLSESPLNADQMREALNVSRGNVSMGLKELVSWRLILLRHIPGDRKEYYCAAGSIWDMANTVFEERRKREIDPTLSLLRNNIMDDTSKEAPELFAQQRVSEIHDLLETITQWSSELQRLSPEKLNTLMRLGVGVSKVLDISDKFKRTKTD
ncbi:MULTISPECIES: GbsR/MarR family transcriptional regulator [Corallincola]|uniref:HTH-type transcriptional regulator n=3 Tax=Corallincola TaxID=1775176 RepID=A0A368NP63_9GAMM|nr:MULTISPECIES: MarR family transcriptional regulator [Corallincola]RCU51091.1 transcriptional regulator [Corallincola holothuriorum]TAA46022.1 transcriptional regulator [Corallincola spongiicola]TCI04132.1 transcriptional regulator [Corallincola luteus]